MSALSRRSFLTGSAASFAAGSFTTGPALAQRSGITGIIHNRAGGFVGQSIWDTHEVISPIDPRWVGYCFDPAEDTAEGGLGGWESGLRLALPRLKALGLDGMESYYSQYPSDRVEALIRMARRTATLAGEPRK